MAAAGASSGLGLVALLCATAFARASASPLGVSSRLELPSAVSIGVAPRTRWVDEREVARGAVAAAAPAPAPAPAAIRATLEVVVPTPAPAPGAASTARVVCCPAVTPSTTPANDDDGPPVFVGSDDRGAVSRDDTHALADGGGDGGGDGGAEGGGHTDSKVFFVDEDSDEDAIKDLKTKKKDKKTGNVPIVVSYDGWKGKTEDDIPIDPDRRRHYNFNYDMHHDYSGISAPAHYGSINPRPLYKTVRTSDVPVTFWDVPLGSETLLVHRLLKSPASNDLYPPPSPSSWRPTYVNTESHNQWSRGPNNRYPGGYRSVVHKRLFQPTPSPGFYGSVQPRVYPSPPPPPGPSSGVWCPPRSPNWPSTRPLYPTTTSTTTSRPVLNVKDKLDFDDAEEDDDKGDDLKKTPSGGDVKIIGKVELDDFKK